jgi:hypothetical protein
MPSYVESALSADGRIDAVVVEQWSGGVVDAVAQRRGLV